MTFHLFLHLLGIITKKRLTARPLNEPAGGTSTAYEVLFAANPQEEFRIAIEQRGTSSEK